jgi:hypothetical protein
MAQTFLVQAPVKTAKGKIFRIVKDRSWDDMPFSFLVQVRKSNYSLGQMRTTWAYTNKCETLEEAQKIFNKKIGA